MKRALSLAARAKGGTSPNPMVGALIVRGGRIVAEGYHRRAGEDHAEVVALAKAGKKSKGAELFVNLEPCTHRGRTPPCTPRVIASGVKRVVVGMTDPNPLVAGRGIKTMRKAGIDVEVGVLEKECMALNEVFVHWITKKKPLSILKVAMSLDGKIATRLGKSQWITGPESRRDVHRLRARVDAIIVGAGTVRADNPSLTARGVKVLKQPIPVVLSTDLKLPRRAKVFSHPAGCIVATTSKAPAAARKKLEAIGVDVINVATRGGFICWAPLLEKLSKRDITSVLIEGGGKVFGSALYQEAADKIVAYVAPMLIGGDDAPGAFRGKGFGPLEDATRLQNVKIRRFGPDIGISGQIKEP